MSTPLLPFNRLRTIMVLTGVMFSFAVMNQFWTGLHMDQAQINLSQSIFKLVVIALSLLLGHWADRHSRVRAVVLGNAITGLGFLWYATAHGFWTVVIGEIIVGFGISFVDGADSGLQRAYCELGRRKLSTEQTILGMAKPAAFLVAIIIGQFCSLVWLRSALVLDAIPYFAAAWLAWRLPDLGDRNTHTPLKEVLKDIGRCRARRWSLAAAVTSREITHTQVWIFYPLMLQAGVPRRWTVIGFCLQTVVEFVGGWLAHRIHYRLAISHVYGWSMAVCLVACAGLAWHIGVLTILAGFVCFGLMRGWSSSRIVPLVTATAQARHVSATGSVNTTAAGIVYALLSYVTGKAAVIDQRYVFWLILVIFTPAAMLITHEFIRHPGRYNINSPGR